MSFTFLVEKAGTLPAAGICYLDGVLEKGKITGSETAAIDGMPNRTVFVKSVAIAPSQKNALTISISRPDFPIEELQGKKIVFNSTAEN